MYQITDNQRALILLAVETGGRIENFPDNLRGGARTAVTRSLLLNDLIATDGAGHALTDAGYEVVGLEPPMTDIVRAEEGDGVIESGEENADNESDASHDVDGDADADAGDTNAAIGVIAEAVTPAPAKERKPNRIAQVVALLMRPQGVTIKEVMAATDWQQHSVRGFFAGTLKKKGYTVINEKAGKEDRVYRIQTEEAKEAERAAAPTTSDEEE
ncbi:MULTISPECIES: DUF3489 domain-containing protein [unclassified Lysobacter]|uniref:DUF3489 domain-containing protein n=1 Tax=unclassified Lysobacter TaxID=2635362 RepID=UPI001BE7FA72|nr:MULTISPECIES: DUF3489 domain-containing protein [unclassified Lysobacter]MBT2748362.1 DUF3489 domain-containing protein [Lysobacter sp. ISL-42]MBT2749871.1 DUF3489 domain-containing protein [Lysobacter sp. ISL-50]MBT2781199.1 DUF3489 domain-containing protein [Lysobacter sp. ISL-52]